MDTYGTFNPLPDDKLSLQFCVPPCPVCGRIIKDDDKAVQCYKKCKRWFHKECINLRFSVYVRCGEKITLRWSCERRECRTMVGEEVKDEWASTEGMELLVPERDRILVLPENTIYKTKLQDDELTSSMLYCEKKVSEPKTERLRLAPDKEILSSLTSSKPLPRKFTNELLDTYNKRIKERQRIERRRKEGFRMETIKSFFMNPDKSEPEPTKQTRGKKSKLKSIKDK